MKIIQELKDVVEWLLCRGCISDECEDECMNFFPYKNILLTSHEKSKN